IATISEKKTKISSIMQVTSLNDAKPFENGWKVHVKHYIAVHGDTLEIVITDEYTYMEIKGCLLPVEVRRH
ncbi:unnamed protein product, partial [Brassica oleracea]